MLRTYIGLYYTDVMFYNSENLKKFVVPNFTRRIWTRNALWYKALVTNALIIVTFT